MTQNNPPDRWL